MIKFAAIITAIALFLHVSAEIREYDMYCTPSFSETTERIAELAEKAERAIEYIEYIQHDEE